MEKVLQILREEETTFNLTIKTRMDGINAEAFYSRRKNEKQTRLCYICMKANHQTTSSPQTGRNQLPVLKLKDVQNHIPVRRSERLKSKQMFVHLTNNAPNSYFEAKNSANWQNWKLAMENELDSLDEHKVWEIAQKPSKSKLIKTKWVHSLKQDDAGKNIKYKARHVAAGFNQIKNLNYSESYSPVVNIESFRLLIALAAKLKLNVNFFDVKTAYLYGDLEETVCVTPSWL
ncbi:copia protein [Trichonephila clavipes]|nr:copia protein [Trichonephila clavipes]